MPARSPKTTAQAGFNVTIPPIQISATPICQNRHTRLLDLRNKFIAHSSAEGTRVQIIPPGVRNPLGMPAKPAFDFNVGKRAFQDVRYVEWLRVAPATFKSRLHSDLSHLLTEAFGSDSGLNAPRAAHGS